MGLGVGLPAGLDVGFNTLSIGTLTLSGGLLSSPRTEIVVGEFGTGSFAQTGGTLASSNLLIMGHSPGSIGSYFLSAGSMTTAEVVVADFGTGTFTQSGGSNNAGSLAIGLRPGSSGTYNLTAGSLSANAETVGLLGVSNNANGFEGSIIQSGGINNVGTLTFYSGSINPTEYLLSGGILAVSGSENILGFSSLLGSADTAGFLQSGGLNSAASLSIDANFTNNQTAIFNLEGGTLSIAKTATVATTSGTASFTQSGGLFTAANLVVSTLSTFMQNAGAASIGSLSNGGNIFIGTGGNLTVNSSFSQTAGQTNVNGRLTLQGGGTINGGTLQIGGNGVVDITNSSLAINYGSPANDPVATIFGYLVNGYNGGAWTGTAGIISTTAQTQGGPALSVGYVDGNTDTGTAAGPNQILIKYTLAGDANLDGVVNFADLVAVVQNFNKGGTDWAQGNFLYAASTNFDDLVTVVQNFNKVLTPAASSEVPQGGKSIALGPSIGIHSTAVVAPEPSIFGITAFGAMSLLRRRRTKRERNK